MKGQKLFLGAATACLLLGASGAAMAQDSTCDGRYILNETVDNVTVDGFECTIIRAVINGDVTATNGAQLQMLRNKIFGTVSLSGTGDSFVSGNILLAGDIVVGSTGDGIEILVSSNVIHGPGDITFTNVGESLIYENTVNDGAITCTNSLAIAEANYASGGTNCPFAGP